MPRRIPLLGVESKNDEKVKRPFTMQSEQEIWDIGEPKFHLIKKPLCSTAFRANLISGKYPFEQDHSGSLSEIKLGWLTEIQTIDFHIVMPDLIEGLTENHPTYFIIAKLALSDILKHGPLEKIVECLPQITYAIKKVLMFNNETVARRIVFFLKEMCVVQTAIGPDLAYYMHELLLLFNRYMVPEQMKDNNDQIMYEQRNEPDLYDEITDLMHKFQIIAGSEYDLATRSLKKAIPTFQINNL